MSNRTLLIVGAGGHGKAVAEAAILSGQWQAIVFIDDRWPDLRQCAGWPVVANVAGLGQLGDRTHGAIAAVGDNTIRERCVAAIRETGVPLVSVVHPRAFVSPSVKIGAGSAVMAMATVCTDALIGSATIVNANSTVDHDAVLEDLAHLGVGVQLAGGVRVKARALLQAGCSAGYGAVIDAGAVLAPGTVIK